MFFSKAFTLLATAGIASAAPANDLQARQDPPPGADLNFVYARGDFSTISGPSGGSNSVHSAGFTILTSDGTELFNTGASDTNASPCANPDMEYRVTSSCWEGEYSFKCSTDGFTNYEGCSVVASDDKTYDGTVGPTDTNFIGIAISVEKSCGGTFKARNPECGPGSSFTVASHNP